MTTQDKKQEPLQTISDGRAIINLWEQHSDKGAFVTASVGCKFTNTQGEFKVGRSFTETDLLKLQAILPETLQEMEKWKEYYREVDRQQEAVQTHDKPPKRDMAAERDAVMQSASQSKPEQAQERTSSRNNEPVR